MCQQMQQYAKKGSKEETLLEGKNEWKQWKTKQALQMLYEDIH